MANIIRAKAFPKINNEDILEFQVPQSKFQMLLSEVYLHFTVRLDQSQVQGGEIVPQNWFGAKQFSSVEVKLNDESVSRRSMHHEYALSAYLNTLVNYPGTFMKTSCRSLGVFDDLNMSTKRIAELKTKKVWTKVESVRKSVTGDYVYEIIMPIDNTLFYSDDLLPSGQKWSLSFERAPSTYSVLKTTDKTDVSKLSKTFDLEDVFLMVPYINDEKSKLLESNWIHKPLSIGYDKYNLQRFSIPEGSTSVRLPNIINGKLPKIMFFGLMKESAYLGDISTSSTIFQREDLIELDLLYNGVSVSGMPMRMDKDCVVLPYAKFLDNMGHFLNKTTASTMKLQTFNDHNFLHCQQFSKDTVGSLSFELQFQLNVPKGRLLIVWSIFDVMMEIDQYGNFTTE